MSRRALIVIVVVASVAAVAQLVVPMVVFLMVSSHFRRARETLQEAREERQDRERTLRRLSEHLRRRPVETAEVTLLVTDAPEGGLATLVVEGEPTPRRRIVRDGRVRFRHLPRDREITAYVVAGDRCALRRGVETGDAGHAIDVPLYPSRHVRGRILLPGDAKDADVRIEILPGVVRSAEVEADGRFDVGGLPAGEWTVVASAWVGGERVEGRVVVDAGATVEIGLFAGGR